MSTTSSTVELSWDKLGSSVDEYIIEYRAPSKSSGWEKRYELDNVITSGIITGLDMGTKYEFRLRVDTDGGYSAHSETVTAKTMATSDNYPW